MAKSEKKGEKKILLRLPVALAKSIEHRAGINQRSVNGQIVYELSFKK